MKSAIPTMRSPRSTRRCSATISRGTPTRWIGWRPSPDWQVGERAWSLSSDGGPGLVVNHLAGLGLTAIGYDISPGQIAEARKAFPDSHFEVGDLTALDLADSSLGGIVSRYSLIHLPPSHLRDVFREWRRVLEIATIPPREGGRPFDQATVLAIAPGNEKLPTGMR